MMEQPETCRKPLETPPAAGFRQVSGFQCLIHLFQRISIINNPETGDFLAAPSMMDHMVRIIKIAIYLKFLVLYV